MTHRTNKKPRSASKRNPGKQQKLEEAIGSFDFDAYSRHRAASIKSWNLLSPAYFYGHEIPGLHEISKGYAWGYCPFCKEPEQTFCVNLTTGAYRCMAPECREEGSDMLAFARNYMGMDHFRAIRYLDAAQGEIA